ncbi:hypothetical protein PRIPAC_89832 [Pristionchus pacificus]|uniref:Uncharacterized protein n=1 Tax=Pristionchus pacificus TaxID=54126 RepID=A0A2A6CWY4_PRIPA|nr:hypothetical protein PRIPAC_89832 [Pristionchus pacificus]|eukprot:PDM82732.1 hypothetical protein PRIPAC_37125 [Pristionchus pacificus]
MSRSAPAKRAAAKKTAKPAGKAVKKTTPRPVVDDEVAPMLAPVDEDEARELPSDDEQHPIFPMNKQHLYDIKSI